MPVSKKSVKFSNQDFENRRYGLKKMYSIENNKRFENFTKKNEIIQKF